MAHVGGQAAKRRAAAPSVDATAQLQPDLVEGRDSKHILCGELPDVPAIEYLHTSNPIDIGSNSLACSLECSSGSPTMSRPNGPSRSDNENKAAESLDKTRLDHAAVGIAAIKDLKREWELAPFREALERFIQSDEIIVKRPSFRPLPNLQHIISDQPISPLLKSSKHSIIYLLQLYDVNIASKAEEFNENRCRSPPAANSFNEVQTQTYLEDSLASIPTADGDVCSRKSTGGDDKYDEESFLSYDSNCNNILPLERPRSCVQCDEEKEAYEGIWSPQKDEHSAPYDSKPVATCTIDTYEKEHAVDDEVTLQNIYARAMASELDVPPVQLLLHNQKGCAWVFDLNQEAAVVEKSAGDENQSKSSGQDDSDGYNSSFLSDDHHSDVIPNLRGV